MKIVINIIDNKILPKMCSLQNKSNDEIIQSISKIVEPKFTFHMDDFYGDKGGILYPDIEELSTLHFKFNGSKYKIPSEKEKEELIKKIKELEISNIENIEIVKYQYWGLFIRIVLTKYNKTIAKLYNEYLDYRNIYVDKINKVYCYLNEEIPEEFVGWVLFNQYKKM